MSPRAVLWRDNRAEIARTAAPLLGGTFECFEDASGRCINPAHSHRPRVELVPCRPGQYGQWLRSCHSLAFGWAEVGNLRGYQA